MSPMVFLAFSHFSQHFPTFSPPFPHLLAAWQEQIAKLKRRHEDAELKVRPSLPGWISGLVMTNKTRWKEPLFYEETIWENHIK